MRDRRDDRGRPRFFFQSRLIKNACLRECEGCAVDRSANHLLRAPLPLTTLPWDPARCARQFGFKLRAQDACNLVYAMWRIEPDSKLVVSIKENPGQHLSAECRNLGYRNIKPQRSPAIPKLRAGDVHTLRAEMTPTAMNLYIDETLAWQGPLSSNVLKWDSRVGIRSDNVRVQFDLHTGPLEPDNARIQSCKSESAGEE